MYPQLEAQVEKKVINYFHWRSHWPGVRIYYGRLGHFLAFQVDFLLISCFLSFLSIKMSEDCPYKEEKGRLPTRTTVKYLHFPGTGLDCE